jgi:D-glycero-alpha-D-manno-heptose-7-phosphate kinase
MLRIVAKAPTRVDIAGGTLDLWPIHHMMPAAHTVNFGVGLWAQCEIEEADEYVVASRDQQKGVSGDFEDVSAGLGRIPLLSDLLAHYWSDELPAISLTTTAESPAGAGLGGSSCLAVAIVRALIEARNLAGDDSVSWNENDVVEVIRDVESRIICAPAGIQDYWGGVRGGLNVISFPPGRPSIYSEYGPLFEQLNDSVALVYCGKSRDSAMNNLEIYNRFLKKDSSVVASLTAVGEIATKCAISAMAGDFERVLQLSEQEWEMRKKLWPGVVTAETGAIDLAARKAGARFSRVCGAGGGGVVAVFSEAKERDAVIDACSKVPGARVLPFDRAIEPVAVRVED